MLALARMERRRITEGWSVAQEKAVARGVHVASKAPTGYLRGPGGRLVPDEAHREAVAALFTLRAAGRSWAALAAHMNAHAVPSPHGVTHWHGGSVLGIVKNPVYTGQARSGQFTNADAHEALVDRGTWEAAQVARGVAGARSGAPALLSGLVRCAACRYAMKPNRMKLRDGSTQMVYRCRGEGSGGDCPNRAAVTARLLEDHVVETFFRAVGDMEAVPHVSCAEVDALTLALADAEQGLAAFRDDEEIGDALGRERFLDGIRARARKVDAARSALAEATASVTVGALPDQATLTAMWPDLDMTERKALLRSGVDVVVVRHGRGLAIEDRALVLLAGDGPDDLPRRGRRPEPLRPFAWPASGRPG